MKKSILILFVFIFGIINAQQMGHQSLDQLMESPAGSKIIKWLDLINSGDEITEEMVNQLFSKRLLDKFTASELANMLTDAQQNDAPLALYVANRVEKFKYENTYRYMESDSWLSGFILLEKTPPYLIDGFSLDDGDRPDDVEEPIYAEMNSQPKPVAFIPPSKLANKADAIAQAYHDMGWFSGIVMMAENGNVNFKKSYGLADIENNIPNTTDTKFRIGSINKDYTAVLVLQQVQRGNISLDDKLSKFNLGFPNKTADKITVRHLLNHTAGFADIFIPKYNNNIRAYKNINDILPLLMHEPLIYEPGKDQRYSNYGFIVLGAILEKTTGKTFGQLLNENIHSITGCKNTHYEIAEKINGEAQSYRYSVFGKKINHTAQLEYPTPDGGIYATAQDVLTFFQTLFFTEKLIENKFKVMMMADYQKTKHTWEDI